MLTNSGDQLGVLLSKVSSGLTSLQISASRHRQGELPEPATAGEDEEGPVLNEVKAE